ncbi:MAG: hypothetical protein ACOYL3_25065 [Desulfuromonadaceae bacterium]
MRCFIYGNFLGFQIYKRVSAELFIILEREATLRSPEGFKPISKGDLLFFEEGPSGAHQLYNHGDKPLVYIDLRTKANIDVCEYPGSGKISILPAMNIFLKGSKVPCYTGEEEVREHWPEELLNKIR